MKENILLVFLWCAAINMCVKAVNSKATFKIESARTEVIVLSLCVNTTIAMFNSYLFAIINEHYTDTFTAICRVHFQIMQTRQIPICRTV